MDEEYKNQWIQTLLGPTYPSTKYYLQDEKGYCPLGVLCDIHPDVEKEKREGGIYFSYEGESKRTTLPEPFRKEMDIPEKFVDRIQKFNDNGKAVKYIASWIEENL